MKKKQSIFFGFAVLMIAVMITVAGCGSANGGPTGGNPDPISVTGVTLNKPALTLAVEGTETLTATVSPDNATNKAVTWSSSDTETATVTNGLVTLVKAGSATITVTTTDGGFTATCTVTDFGTEFAEINTVDFGAGSITYTIFDSADSTTALDDYLKGIAGTPGNYAVTVTGTGHEIAPSDSYSVVLASGVKISLRGDGTLLKTGNAYMWWVMNGAKLILRGPTLDGNQMGYSLVQIFNLGEFVMEGGTITGSNNGFGYCGGVHNEGTFTMNGGTINDNKSGGGGGGVYVTNSTGPFTMNGGSITNNTANGNGGGVYVSSPRNFIMTGGSITNNTARGSSGGGGVYVEGTFNLNPPAGKASISGNILSGSGSGVQVFVSGTGTFKVNGTDETSY